MVKSLKHIILLYFSLNLLYSNNSIHVITTNDMHGFINQQNANFINPNFPPIIIGGSGYIKYVNDLRDSIDDELLILDGGNFFQGHPLGIFDRGRTMIDWMNIVEYDALVPGANDFLFGIDNLVDLSRQAAFNFLACNLFYKDSNNLIFEPYTIVEIKNIKIGIIGLVNPDLENLVLSTNLKNVNMKNPIDMLNDTVLELKNKTDVVILLTSSGVPWDREEVYNNFINDIISTNSPEIPLNAIELGYYANGVDIIVSGGISKGYNRPWYDPHSHVYTFQNYGNGTSFGHFSINIDKQSKLFTGFDYQVKNSISQTLFLHDFDFDESYFNWIEEKSSNAISQIYNEIDWSARIDSDDQDITINQTSNKWDFPNINNINGLDIITWNCEFFPTNGDSTIDALSEAIIEMNPDIIAFQEIKKRGWFSKLMLYLPDYDFIISQQSSFMDQAIIYKKNLFDLVGRKELFAENDYFFAGRPPLQCDLLFKDKGLKLSVINLHMKCCDSGLNRRKLAANQLYDYVNSELNKSLSNQFIILGDWNDDLKDDDGEHCFDPFLNDNRFFFPTLDITYDISQASYPKEPYVSFLDHILVSKSLIPNNSYDISTIPIDKYMGSFSIYEEYISDHMPVLLSF